MGKLIFDRHWGTVCQTFFRPIDGSVPSPALADMFSMEARLSELLLSHEGLCFSIDGENCLIPVLLKAFGVDGTVQLLEEGAIRFFLQSESILYLARDVPGIMPLQSGRAETLENKDPEASVDSILDAMLFHIPGETLRRLKRALTDAYVSSSRPYAPSTVDLAHRAYSQGRFRRLGLSVDKPITELSIGEREILCRLASDLRDLAIIADLGMETIDEVGISHLCDESLANLNAVRKVVEASSTIFKIENVPDVAKLVGAGIIKSTDVPALRRRQEVIRFREWLDAAARESDASEISRMYIDAVVGKSDFLSTARGKVARTITVAGLASIVSTVAAAPLGQVAGPALAVPIATALDFGVDMIDQFVLDGLLKGWQPRHYFDRVLRPAIAAAKNPDTKAPARSL